MIRYILSVIVLAMLSVSGATADDEGTGIVVNGVELSRETIVSLESRYGLRIADAKLSNKQVEAVREIFGIDIQDGRFWYDAISGAWGYEGLPAAGQIQPNLPVGGDLKADASGGETNVAVNGRILHRSEYSYLVQRFGYVIPGRYYLLPDGSYGLEGGPVMGSIAPSQGRSVLGGRNKFGTAIGDDDGFVGYIPPNHGGSRTPNVSCAPDGGCIFQ